MALDALQEIKDRHQTIEQSQIHLHEVPDERVGSFATPLWSISNDEAIQASGEWTDVVSRLNTYFFHLRSLPVSSDNTDICPYEAIDKLSALSDKAEATQPQIAAIASNLQDSVEWLATTPYSVLGEYMDEKLCRSEEGLEEAVILKDREHIGTVQEEIAPDSDTEKPEILYYRDVSYSGFDRLHIPGRPWWFPDHLFRSPPAREVHVYSYAWHRDSIDVDPVFNFGYPRSGSQPEVFVVRPEEDSGKEAVDADLKALDDITNTIDPSDWDAAIGEGTENNGEEPGQDTVPASLYRLEDDLLALMPVGEEKVTSLDLDGQTPEPIRISASSIQPGEFVVLRKDPSDDLVRQVANQILGEKKEEVREKQKDWKSRLKARCKEKGVKAVAGELQRRGAETARKENVYRWIEGDTIRPRSENDFRTVMEYIGLEDLDQDYWGALSTIISAHQRAGHKIKDLLLARVKETDVDGLLQRGRMDFTIAEGSAQMTAARILEVVELDAEVHPRRLKAILN